MIKLDSCFDIYLVERLLCLMDGMDCKQNEIVG